MTLPGLITWQMECSIGGSVRQQQLELKESIRFGLMARKENHEVRAEDRKSWYSWVKSVLDRKANRA
jgi:hypothetical protein